MVGYNMFQNLCSSANPSSITILYHHSPITESQSREKQCQVSATFIQTIQELSYLALWFLEVSLGCF